MGGELETQRHFVQLFCRAVVEHGARSSASQRSVAVPAAVDVTSHTARNLASASSSPATLTIANAKSARCCRPNARC